MISSFSFIPSLRRAEKTEQMVRTFFSAFTCYFFLHWLSVQLVQAAITCPPDDAYAPCYCYEYIGKSETLTIDCQNRNLSDSKISEILDVFLTTTNNISPVSQIDLTSNQLTRIPRQIRSFSQLEDVFLIDNPIKSIEWGDFNTTGHNPSIFIGNQLTTIAPGAFTGLVIW